MPKRKARADSGSPKGDKKAKTNCPVCLEDTEHDKLDLFPCGHATCTLCGTRCVTCPLCRMGRDGRSDEERRDAEQHFQALAGARLVVTQVPSHRIAEFIGGDGSTPFSAAAFTITTQGLTGPMNNIVGSIVEHVMDRQRATGRAFSRGELQQATSVAMMASAPPARNVGSRRQAGIQGSRRPSEFVVRDILGRPVELDAEERRESVAER